MKGNVALELTQFVEVCTAIQVISISSLQSTTNDSSNTSRDGRRFEKLDVMICIVESGGAKCSR
jgi:hypothetical protein